jgi:membrane protein DedA with SNARE-associated domain
MEMNELMSAWKSLEQRLERDNSLHLALLRERRLDRARSSLRPLAIGQVMQIAMGVAVLLLAATLWSTRPSSVPVIIAGAMIHTYGIGCIITAALTIAAMHRIGYSESVISVQSKLVRVRRAYVVSSIVAGLTWWFLWIPLLMVLAALIGVDLYAHAPSVVWIGVVIGIAGCLLMLWLYLLSRSESHPRLRKAADNAVFGRSLMKAQAQIDELIRFEQEHFVIE